MPATVLDADALMGNLSLPWQPHARYKPGTTTERNAYKLARAMALGFHEESGVVMDQLEPQRFDYTAEQGFLDNRADFWKVPRRPDESDASLRLRIGAVKLVQWGALNIDEMLELVAFLLNTDALSVEVTENVDEAGGFEPGLVTFYIDPTVFTLNQIDDAADATEDLRLALERVVPAGVRVRVISSGTAVWDNGTQWDAGFTWG